MPDNIIYTMLLKEEFIQFYPSLAVLLGSSDQSLVFQKLSYLLTGASKNHNEYVLVDGFYWVYNSYEQWQEFFPWLSIKSIQRHFAALEKKGLVIAVQGLKNPYDRRKWYRIDYDELARCIRSNCPDGEGQNDLMYSKNSTKNSTENLYAASDVDGRSEQTDPDHTPPDDSDDSDTPMDTFVSDIGTEPDSTPDTTNVTQAETSSVPAAAPGNVLEDDLISRGEPISKSEAATSKPAKKPRAPKTPKQPKQPKDKVPGIKSDERYQRLEQAVADLFFGTSKKGYLLGRIVDRVFKEYPRADAVHITMFHTWFFKEKCPDVTELRHDGKWLGYFDEWYIMMKSQQKTNGEATSSQQTPFKVYYDDNGNMVAE